MRGPGRAALLLLVLATASCVRAAEQQLSVTITDGEKAAAPAPSAAAAASADGKLPGGGYNYTDVLFKSFLFYEAQRSGKLPPDNRVPWRGDAHLADEHDGNPLTGGYYDAGDFLKITYPLSFALSQLAWGLLEFREGYAAAGQLVHAERALQWGLDWLLKAHWDNDDKLVVLVGDPNIEHKSWNRPEDAYGERPAYLVSKKRPGADAWASAAAAFAAGAVVFKGEEEYADELLDHAATLFRYATDSKYEDSLFSDTLEGDAAKLYKSTRSADDIAWAGLWLYEATGDKDYLKGAEKRYFKAQNNRWVFVDVPKGGSCSSDLACYWASTRTWNWDNAYPGAMVMMAAVRDSDDSVWDDVRSWLGAWVDGDAIVDKTRGGLSCVPCTDCGWGADRDTINAAFLALVAAKYEENAATRNRWRCWAQSQLDFMLGGSDGNRSRVVGFGIDPPTEAHHRGSSCPAKPAVCSWSTFDGPQPNANVLYGALVSGSCSDEFVDDREDYKSNEVALDKNSAFTGAVAALQQEVNQCRTSPSG